MKVQRIFFFPTQSEQGAIWGAFYSKVSEEAKSFPIDQISDVQIKLQLMTLQDKGSGALDADKGAHVSLHACEVKYTVLQCQPRVRSECWNWN